MPQASSACAPCHRSLTRRPEWIGLWERINISVFLLWIVVLAAVLLMREWPPEVDAAQRAERSIA